MKEDSLDMFAVKTKGDDYAEQEERKERDTGRLAEVEKLVQSPPKKRYVKESEPNKLNRCVRAVVGV